MRIPSPASKSGSKIAAAVAHPTLGALPGKGEEFGNGHDRAQASSYCQGNQGVQDRQ
jgi:hypothetical protein